MAEGDTEPIGYTLQGGTWVTTAHRETADHYHDGVSARIKTGTSSVWFDDATGGGNVYLEQNVTIPCASGDLLRVSGWFQGDTNAAGDHGILLIDWRDDDDAFISYGTAFDAEATTADTWEYKSAILQAPANAVGWRLIFGKAKSNAGFNAWWDSVFVEQVLPAFSAYLNADQTIGTGADTEIGYNTELYDYGGVFDTAQHRFTAPAAGIYSISAGAMFSNLADQVAAVMKFYKNGVSYRQIDIRQASGASTVNLVGILPCEFLSAGDYIEVYVIHNAAGDEDVLGTSLYSYFQGAKIA